MKTIKKRQCAGILAAGLAVGASCLGWMPSETVAGVPADSKGFIEKMDQWQNRMSEKFRDTWKGLRNDSPSNPGATASVDLREDQDHYTLRLNRPDGDLEKVEITLSGDTL